MVVKVLHICPGYFQRKLYEKLLIALSENGVINEVFTINSGNSSENSCKYLPFKVNVLNKKFNFFDRLFYFGKQNSVIRRIIQDYSFDDFTKIHAHTLFSGGLSALRIFKKYQVPYIVTVRNTDINLFLKYMVHLRFIGREIVKNSQYLIFLSPSYRDHFIGSFVAEKDKKLTIKKSLVIPNGIDKFFLDNKFTGKRTIEFKRARVIFIGELKKNKNIETTIKACKLLINKGYKVEFTVIGQIVDCKYKRVIRENKFITYQGNFPKEKILYSLRMSEIFVMPSVTESFGIVYAEAMSQGIPVIYTKNQGFDGQFEDGIVGYAVDCYDHNGIAARIIDIYNHYEQFSERCISLSEKFNWVNIALRYRDIY
jgi:glycosyltransferase involved in cell wall biosynthesis